MKSKPIEGFERYEIRENGDVYDTLRGRCICEWVDSLGYKQCYLRDNTGKKHSKRIHRLLALAFIPNPDSLPQVNHLDGNSLNNSLDNLEWTTNSGNTQHGYDHNLYMFKTRCHSVNAYDKATHMLLGRYKSIRGMCSDLGVNRKTVTMILKGKKLTNNYEYEFEYSEDNKCEAN